MDQALELWFNSHRPKFYNFNILANACFAYYKKHNTSPELFLINDKFVYYREETETVVEAFDHLWEHFTNDSQIN